MSWNYRIFKLKDCYALCEAYYDDSNPQRCVSRTDAITVGESPEEIYEDLVTMLFDAKAQTVLEDLDEVDEINPDQTPST